MGMSAQEGQDTDEYIKISYGIKLHKIFAKSHLGLTYDIDGDPIIRMVHHNSPPGMSGGGGRDTDAVSRPARSADCKLEPYENSSATVIVLPITLLGNVLGQITVTSAFASSIIFSMPLFLTGDTRIAIVNPHLDGTHTSRGNPDDYSWDPEIRRLQNETLFPPGTEPPNWFFWLGLGGMAYELYTNRPIPELPTAPTDRLYVAPRIDYWTPGD